ncbi:MAG: hypothetical protein WC655_27150, partial [Candidatus Hydrogenedentales bacterium]
MEMGHSRSVSKKVALPALLESLSTILLVRPCVSSEYDEFTSGFAVEEFRWLPTEQAETARGRWEFSHRWDYDDGGHTVSGGSFDARLERLDMSRPFPLTESWKPISSMRSGEQQTLTLRGRIVRGKCYMDAATYLHCTGADGSEAGRNASAWLRAGIHIVGKKSAWTSPEGPGIPLKLQAVRPVEVWRESRSREQGAERLWGRLHTSSTCLLESFSFLPPKRYLTGRFGSCP